MCLKLQTVYDEESVVSVHLLQRKFFTNEFIEDDLSTYISKMEDIKSKLKRANEPTSETRILMSLPNQCTDSVLD